MARRDDRGWARYAIAREDTLVQIPDELLFEQAAIARRGLDVGGPGGDR
ncbi:hypothetical protein [Saccharopolyspora erythraea]|nr:hypothetical protein [Saccharopolyspora erythraea]